MTQSTAYYNNTCLTLTAIHPDGKHHTPSRHIPLNQPQYLQEALIKLLETNQMGWGAYIAIGLRRMGLNRYQRGAETDIIALPALFVDVDDPSTNTLTRLQALRPYPSCITFTGGGYHAYWWLDEPVSDIQLARRILRGLQGIYGGDSLSVVTSLRLPGSCNTKPQRNNAICHIVDLQDYNYPIENFSHLISHPKKSISLKRRQHNGVLHKYGDILNPTLLQVVSDQLTQMGYVRRGDWLSGPCLYPIHHQHQDRHPSFGFNIHTGYGNCYVCGSILLKTICTTLAIQPTDYGGLYI